MSIENEQTLPEQPKWKIYGNGTVDEWLMQQARDIATQVGISDDVFTKDPEIDTDDSDTTHQCYEIYEGKNGAEVFLLRQYAHGTLLDARVVAFNTDDTCIRSVVTRHKKHYFSITEDKEIFYTP